MNHGVRRMYGQAIAAVLTATFVGCTDHYERVSASGTVTCNGKPVQSGSIWFNPKAPPPGQKRPDGLTGKSAVALVQSDGTFTFPEGVLTGTHTTQYMREEAPSITQAQWDAVTDEYIKAATKSMINLQKPTCGNSVSPGEVEVVKGEKNHFELQLTGRVGRPDAENSP